FEQVAEAMGENMQEMLREAVRAIVRAHKKHGTVPRDMELTQRLVEGYHELNPLAAEGPGGYGEESQPMTELEDPKKTTTAQTTGGKSRSSSSLSRSKPSDSSTRSA